MVIGAGGYAGLGSSLDLVYDSGSKNLTAGGMTLTNTTSAISVTSGALVVAGGVGISGDLYVGGALSVPFVGTATNIKDGTAGQVPYQTATGVTSFFGPGTAGNVLISNGTSAPSYNNTLTLAGTTTATSTQTGALVVAGGVGIGGSLYVGGEIIAQKLTIEYTTVTTTLVQTDDIIRTYNTSAATSTSTGALQIAGGVGIGGDLWVGGSVNFPNATIGRTLNVAGGSTGTVLFQSATSTTAFTSAGNETDILVSRGVNPLGPIFTSTSTIHVGYATVAGSAESTTFATSSSFATSSTYATYANTATDIAGGTAGQLLYQIAPGDTGFAGAGTAGNVLVSNGTSIPTYNNTLTLTSTLSNTTTVASNALYVAGGVGIGSTLYVTGDIYSAGEITAYYSDDRLKTRLENIPDALNKVKSLSGFYYTPNETALKFGYKDKRQVGVSAQDTQKILPEIVTTAPVNADYLTVQYEKFVPLLIEAIKELSAEVEELKKKIQ